MPVTDVFGAIANPIRRQILDLLREGPRAAGEIASEFHLSEYEESFLLTCERGDALIIADQNHVAVKVVASEKEHPLITTNPAELFSA